MVAGATLSQPFGVGESFQQIVRPDAPGAGATFSLAMDPRYVSRLLACTFTFATSAVAANRYVTVQYVGGDGQPFVVNGAALLVLANTTQRFSGAVGRGESEWSSGTDVFFPLLGVYLRGGDQLAIAVAAIDAGDQLSSIRLVFDRFVEKADQLY